MIPFDDALNRLLEQDASRSISDLLGLIND